MIPLPDGLGGVKRLTGLGINRRLIQCIQPSASDRVSGLLIIFELEFGSGRPGGAALVRDMVHDAAVACLGDAVVDL